MNNNTQHAARSPAVQLIPGELGGVELVVSLLVALVFIFHRTMDINNSRVHFV